MAATANIKAVITADDKASRVLSNFGDSTRKTAKRIGVAIAAAGAAATALGVSSVKATLDWTKGTLKLQRELGLTAKSASGLLAVGKRFGLTVDDLSKSFGIFSKKVVAANDGNADARKEFSRYGISVRNAQGELKGFDVLFGEVADKFKDAPGGFNKTAEALKLFGRAGKDLLPILNLGSQGIAEIQAQADKYGLILDQTNVNSVMKFIKLQRESGMAMQGVKIAIGNAIIPALTILGTKIAEFVASDQFKVWIQNLTTWLSTNLPIAVNYVVGTLIPALINIFNALWPTIRVVLAAFGALISFLAANTWIVKGLAAAFVAVRVAMAIKGAVAAFQAGMALVSASIARTRAALVAFRLLAASSVAMGALAVGAAIASIYLVYQALREVQAAIRDVNNAAAASATHSRAQSDTLSQLHNLSKNGTPAQKKRANAALKADVTNATGTSYAPGGTSLVGERGPEIVTLPRGSKVSTADQTRRMVGGGGSVVNLNINIGMYAGTEIEKRKVAKELFRAAQDLANSQGTNIATMFG